jgi:hypothetical protein
MEEKGKVTAKSDGMAVGDIPSQMPAQKSLLLQNFNIATGVLAALTGMMAVIGGLWGYAQILLVITVVAVVVAGVLNFLPLIRRYRRK